MQNLNFPHYDFRFKNDRQRISIFDEVRRKFVALTPEEWVRQHTVKYLQQTKGFPFSLINVEKSLRLNGTLKRYDAVVFAPDGSLHLLVECKSPDVAITQAVFDQIARYNLTLKSQYLMVTNGINHYVCRMDYKEQRYHFLTEVPAYQLADVAG